MEFFYQLLGIFWLLLPAGIANMAPVLVKNIDFLDFPIDAGKKFRGKEIFGSHKTFRGFFFGTLAGIIIAYAQGIFYPFAKSFALIDYSATNLLLLGFLLGFGALAGDSIKSFFKRQIGIKPGQEWWFFDQTDWIVGAFMFLSIYHQFNFSIYLIGIVLMGMLHPLINLAGYYLGMKKNKF
jgi:CDP-2,3-bis-(O-geranylgeranyl)-sn-glycerol synthase